MKAKKKPFWKDDGGQAMTEYAILAAVTVIFCAWLFYPQNGFYTAFRNTFDRTNLVLLLPGP